MLLKRSPARSRFACVEKFCIRALNGIGIPACESGDTTEPLKEIQRGALGGKNGTRQAVESQRRLTGVDTVAVVRSLPDVDIGIGFLETQFCDALAGDSQFFTGSDGGAPGGVTGQ